MAPRNITEIPYKTILALCIVPGPKLLVEASDWIPASRKKGLACDLSSKLPQWLNSVTTRKLACQEEKQWPMSTTYFVSPNWSLSGPPCPSVHLSLSWLIPWFKLLSSQAAVSSCDISAVTLSFAHPLSMFSVEVKTVLKGPITSCPKSSLLPVIWHSCLNAFSILWKAFCLAHS